MNTPTPIRTHRVLRKRWPRSEVVYGFSVTIAAVAFALSYALQRVVSWLAGEPDPTQVILIGHTPFFWRLALATVHSAVVGSIVSQSIDEDWATLLLRFAPLWVPALVLPAAFVLVAIP